MSQYSVRLGVWIGVCAAVARGLAKTMSQACSTTNPSWRVIDRGFLQRLTVQALCQDNPFLHVRFYLGSIVDFVFFAVMWGATKGWVRLQTSVRPMRSSVRPPY